ncbi:hypothetical protein BSKO_10324 [Bryopsis sp. KO-2023]|nr:hypothetical protein BSKO_10324 [Bryopsis sp. KO-2023]
MKVAQPDPHVRGVTCLAVSNDRKLIAAGEELSGSPQVTVFNASTLERLATLTTKAVGKFNSCCFSGDSQFVLAGSGVNGAVQYWNWREGKEVCSGTVSGDMIKVSVDPTNPSNVFTMTQNDIMLWRTSSSSLRKCVIDGVHDRATGKILNERHFLDHCWMPHQAKVLVTTVDSFVLFVERNKLLFTIQLQRPAQRIITTSGEGFVVASQGGNVYVYDKLESSSDYVLSHQLKVPDNASTTSITHIKNLSISQQQEKIAVYVEGDNVYAIDFQLVKSAAFDLERQRDAWSLCLPGFHRDHIQSLDIAVKRDVVVTASRDLSVRVWHFNPIRCEVCHQTTDVPQCVGIHPSGYELLVGYHNKVGTYNIVDGLLLSTGEIAVDKCNIISFSPTGHLVALVEAGGREIHIYETIYYSHASSLQGHFHPVMDITWSRDGMFLTSVSNQAIYTWHMDGFQRVEADCTKSFNHGTVICSPHHDQLVVGDVEGTMRLYKTNRRTVNLDGTLMTGMSENLRPETPLLAQGTSPRRESEVPKRFQRSGMVSAAMSVLPSQASMLNSEPSIGDADVNPISINVVDDLRLQTESCRDLLPPPSTSALSVPYSAMFGSLEFGMIRVMPYPPVGNVCQEYKLHKGVVTNVKTHHSGIKISLMSVGKFLFSTDSTGCWMMHVIVPWHLNKQKNSDDDRALDTLNIRSPAPAPKYCEFVTAAMITLKSELLCKLHQQSDVVILQKLQHQKLQERLDHFKETAVRSAHEMAYRMRETTNKVKAQMIAQVRELEHENEALKLKLEEAQEKCTMQVSETRKEMFKARAEFKSQLDDKDDWVYKKVAREIDRTNHAEDEVQRIKEKFARRLAEIDREAQMARLRHDESIRATETAAHEKVSSAENDIARMKHLMKEELGVEADLNEEELDRVEAGAKVVAEEQEEKNMELWAERQTARMALAKKTREYEALEELYDKLTQDNHELRGHIGENHSKIELLEKIISESNQQVIKKERVHNEILHQMKSSQVFNTVLDRKMEDLREEMQPLRDLNMQTQEELADASEAAMKGMDTITHLNHQQMCSNDLLHHLKSELVRHRQKLMEKERYIDLFQSQLWRTIHTVPVQQWPKMFGKLYDDHVKGTLKKPATFDCSSLVFFTKGRKSTRCWPLGLEDPSWRKYQKLGPESRTSSKQIDSQEAADDPGDLQADEMKRALGHTEKLLKFMKGYAEKSKQVHSQSVRELLAQNASLVSRTNELSKDLKDAKDTIVNQQTLLRWEENSSNPATSRAQISRDSSRPSLSRGSHRRPPLPSSGESRSRTRFENMGRDLSTSHQNVIHIPTGVIENTNNRPQTAPETSLQDLQDTWVVDDAEISKYLNRPLTSLGDAKVSNRYEKSANRPRAELQTFSSRGASGSPKKERMATPLVAGQRPRSMRARVSTAGAGFKSRPVHVSPQHKGPMQRWVWKGKSGAVDPAVAKMGQQASLQLPVGSRPKYACIPRKEDDEFPPLFPSAGSTDFDVIEADLGSAHLDSSTEGCDRPIHHAARENRKDRIVLLVRGGADIGAKTPAGQTPLHLASTITGNSLNKAHILDMLLNQGAYIDAVDKNGRTPLHIAAMEGQLNIATRLCAKGAKRGPVDKDGKIPTDLAQDFGHDEIVSFFQTINKNISTQKIKKYEEFL